METATVHLLEIKATMLTKPSLYTSIPIAVEKHDLPAFSEAFTKDIGISKGLENFALGEMLVLSQALGNIFLGETFSAFICVHNDSNQIAKDIVIKTDLQTSSQRLTLLSATINEPVPKLDPSESIEQVIQHEVKELGMHLLVCAVSYTSPKGEKMFFRKLFKFNVIKPLDVKTKFYPEENEMYLEAQVQNITKVPLTMESVKFEPSLHYTSEDLNDLTSPFHVGKSFLLNPNDTYQYLYRIRTKYSSTMQERVKSPSSAVGKLDIVWRSAMGEKGRLQTSQLQKAPFTVPELNLKITKLPDAICVEKKFEMTCTLQNTSERKFDCQLLMTKSKDGGIVWCGTSGKRLGILTPGTSIGLQLQFLPLATGLQTIGGIKILDSITSKTYSFDDIAKIFVYASLQSPFPT
ncbi:trafficking protein particle complex subunit 13-like isoform X2 [Xenia sp. Carnegie-2017]|uniref:trafficking protein particle complex subunit 13-like isoform X2 n=1 Tax=Xenia sp. Carnegie-2017 TaxID=2897299 RepID=UPI001F04E94A|nr:trafficking protein particle complex subunit 13-like isoform X2 [Xenia sp. Carnegie-2017]